MTSISHLLENDMENDLPSNSFREPNETQMYRSMLLTTQLQAPLQGKGNHLWIQVMLEEEEFKYI